MFSVIEWMIYYWLYLSVLLKYELPYPYTQIEIEFSCKFQTKVNELTKTFNVFLNKASHLIVQSMFWTEHLCLLKFIPPQCDILGDEVFVGN